MKIYEFQRYFPDEAACKEKFREIRLKEGVVCPKCGCARHYFAYKVEGDTVYVYDACHAQNMHEIAKPRRRYTVRLTEEDLRQVIKKSIREALKQFYSAE